MLDNIYPILIDGEEAGTLKVHTEGIRTSFEAECRDPGRIVRLTVFGDGEGYLGIMMPAEDGRLYLEKQMSRLSMEHFPQTIEYAAPAGERAAKYTAGEEHASMQTQDPAPETKVEDFASSDEQNEAGEDEDLPQEPIVLWRKGAGGALIGSCGNARFLAVPLKSGVAPVGENFEKRKIEEIEYAVFEIKNGKIK